MSEVPPQSIRELQSDLEFAVRRHIVRGWNPAIDEALRRLDAKRAATKRHPGYREDDEIKPNQYANTANPYNKGKQPAQEEIKW